MRKRRRDPSMAKLARTQRRLLRRGAACRGVPLHFADILERLAATQANLPVPLTADERTALREASYFIRRALE